MHNCVKIISISLACLIVSACVSTGNTTENTSYMDADRVDAELLSTAKSIQDSIRIMETTTNAKALKGMTQQEVAYAQEQMQKVPPGMERTMTTSTYASLRAVVADAAAMANYRFEEYGRPKKLYLTMDTTLRPVVDVLRDAGNQVKGQAWVCAYPSPAPSQDSNGVIAIKYDGDCQ